eukprot:Clim_evm11s60 gene=Clim_evmTU11s60
MVSDAESPILKARGSNDSLAGTGGIDRSPRTSGGQDSIVQYDVPEFPLLHRTLSESQGGMPASPLDLGMLGSPRGFGSAYGDGDGSTAMDINCEIVDYELDLPLTAYFPRRYIVVILCALAILVCYADRSNISIAAEAMAPEYGWDDTKKGLVFSSFFWGYLVANIIGGFLADRFGGRYVLAFGSIAWSLITVLTPAAADINFGVLLFCRSMLGVGEGLAYPAIHSVIAKWMPQREQSRAVALVTAACYAGQVLANLVSALLLTFANWRWIFYVFGTLGLVWNIPWHRHGTSQPQGHPTISDRELLYIQHEHTQQRLQSEQERERGYWGKIGTTNGGRSGGSGGDYQPLVGDDEDEDQMDGAPLEQNYNGNGVNEADDDEDPQLMRQRSARDLGRHDRSAHPDVDEYGQHPRADSPIASPSSPEGLAYTVPWAKLLSRREVWAILINHFCNGWGTYVLLSWLPAYYHEQYNVDVENVGYYAILPFAVQGVMGIVAGLWADGMISRGYSVLTVRHIAQSVGMLGPAVFLLFAAFVAHTAVAGMVCVTFALAANAFTFVGVSISQLDIAPRYAGVVFAMGNTSATIPGIIGVYLTGWMLATTHSWVLVFSLASGIYVVGAICWLLMAGATVIVD